MKGLNVFDWDVYEYLINHPVPGTPKIRSLNKDSDRLTVIEEFIKGENLQYYINKGIRIPFDTFISYLINIAETLNRLHTSDFPIVHRDLKPSNIIINESGAYLIDFNAAKEYIANSYKTQDTTLIGTHGYAAPEQYGFGVSTPKTDIYAFGILIREFLNRNLVIASSYQLKSLLSISNRCTAFKASERLSSAQHLKDRLLLVRKAFSKKLFDSDLLSYISLNYALPGFRTKSPVKMLVSIPCYFLLLYATCTLTTVENTSLYVVLLYRFFFFFTVMSLILATFNYREIHRFFPFGNSDNLFLKLIGVILADSAIFAALMIIFVGVYNIVYTF